MAKKMIEIAENAIGALLTAIAISLIINFTFPEIGIQFQLSPQNIKLFIVAYVLGAVIGTPITQLTRRIIPGGRRG